MQSPETKFHAIVIGAMVPVIVAGVAWLGPLLSGVTAGQTVLGVVVAALASAGLYKAIAKGLLALLRRVSLIKRFVLGPSFMHGTWVGWFVGHRGDLRYVVEVFEQELGSLVIRGMSFTDTGDVHGQWHSEATLVDAGRGRFLYTCDADILTSGVPFQSLGVFSFARTGETAPPHALDGYVADVHDGVRLPMHTRKIDRKLLNFRDALPRAREVVTGILKQTNGATGAVPPLPGNPSPAPPVPAPGATITIP